MTKREFTKICIMHGFSRHGKDRYVRCCGDGIFQLIYSGFRAYIDPKSPNYSSGNRKSNYISVGIYSLYSPGRKELFDPTERGGGIYSPDDFCPSDYYNKVFHGIDVEYDKMAAYGFEVLNHIRTQEALLDFYMKTKRTAKGNRIHSLSLIAPFLMTGATEDAMTELAFQFTHSWVGKTIESSNSPYAWKEEWFSDLESRMEKILAPTVFLWRALIGRRHQETHQYLQNNYEENLEWISQFGVPLSEDFHRREIPFEF